MVTALAGRDDDLFLATLAHELKTPLGAICGYAEMLAGGHVALDRVKDHAAVLWEAAQTLKGTVEAMLDLALLETGELELDNSDVDLEACTEIAARTLSTSARAREVTISVVIPANLPRVVGDPRMMTQILTNLISNAIKYGPEQGHVEIRASVDRTGQLVIEVLDDGPGISAEEAEIAMQPFRRIDRDASAPGHGLGLPLTKALVELHDGRFSLVSTPGCGTRALVILPSSRVTGESTDGQQAFVFSRHTDMLPGVNHF